MDSQLNMLHELRRLIYEFLQKEGNNGLLRGPVLHNSIRMEVLPQRTSVVPPCLPIGNQAEGPLVPRTRRHVVQREVGLALAIITAEHSQLDYWSNKPIRAVCRALLHHFGYCSGTIEDNDVPPGSAKVYNIP